MSTATPTKNGFASPIARPAHAPVVLVVDDDVAIRQWLEAALVRRGHRVFTAARLPDAVGMFRRQADLVEVALLDVNMPEDSGPEVLKALRQLEPGLPVVFMSGELDRDLTDPLADALRSEGADGLIAKPLDLDALCGILRDTTRRGPRRQIEVPPRE